MSYIIREAVVSDAPVICELNSSEMGYEYPLDSTVKKLESLLRSSKDKIYVAVMDEVVVGYIHANDYDLIYAPHMKNIMGVAVSSRYKRRGIGGALLKRVEKWAIEDGAAGIRLVSGAARADAHSFYRKCGYSGGREQLNFKKMF